MTLPRTKVLDHGYLRSVETWGVGDAGIAEAGIIEAARQSTAGCFRGWERDRRLLAYLFNNKHSTPFEFAGLTIEVRAPVFVFRQWHRHRTQSYNEASGRYIELPCLHYIPTVDRLMMTDDKNKQAGKAKGASPLTFEAAERYLINLVESCEWSEVVYQSALASGVPKELARLNHHMNRYTQMRATANLRNWLSFLTLRMDPDAQWEIRQYANVIYGEIEKHFPHTAELFGRARE